MPPLARIAKAQFTSGRERRIRPREPRRELLGELAPPENPVASNGEGQLELRFEDGDGDDEGGLTRVMASWFARQAVRQLGRRFTRKLARRTATAWSLGIP